MNSQGDSKCPEEGQRRYNFNKAIQKFKLIGPSCQYLSFCFYIFKHLDAIATCKKLQANVQVLLLFGTLTVTWLFFTTAYF